MSRTPKYKVGQQVLLTRNTGPFDEPVEVGAVEWKGSHGSTGIGTNEGHIAWSLVPGEFLYQVRRQDGKTENAVKERDLRPSDRGRR